MILTYSITIHHWLPSSKSKMSLPLKLQGTAWPSLGRGYSHASPPRSHAARDPKRDTHQWYSPVEHVQLIPKMNRRTVWLLGCFIGHDQYPLIHPQVKACQNCRFFTWPSFSLWARLARRQELRWYMAFSESVGAHRQTEIDWTKKLPGVSGIAVSKIISLGKSKLGFETPFKDQKGIQETTNLGLVKIR